MKKKKFNLLNNIKLAKSRSCFIISIFRVKMANIRNEPVESQIGAKKRRQNVLHFEWIMCGTCRWKLNPLKRYNFNFIFCFSFCLGFQHLRKMRHIHINHRRNDTYEAWAQIRSVFCNIWTERASNDSWRKRRTKRHRQNTTIPSIIICNPYTNQNHKQHG